MNGIREHRVAALLSFLRRRILNVVFPFAVTLSLVVMFLEQVERLLHVNPFAEGGVPHRLFEGTIQPLAALPILATAIWSQHGLLRRWPGFLRLSESTALSTTVRHLIAHGIAWFVVVAVSVVLISYLIYDPARDPQGQFHIWVWLGGVFYAMVLAPSTAILSTWLLLRTAGKDRVDA